MEYQIKLPLTNKPNEIPQMSQTFTVAEYFAGIGLVRLGLEKAGWQVVFANDFSPEKYEMYLAYYKDKSHYNQSDVFDLDPASIPHTMLATSSFPCIDLSLAGNQAGIHGKHSNAFWGFIDILKGQEGRMPPIVMLENVTGWLSSNEGKDFRITIQALNNLGYSCDIYSLDAIHFTPQSRPRIFVIGSLTNDRNDNLQIINSRSSLLATQTLKDAVLSNHDLLWNFLPVPNPPSEKIAMLDRIVEEMPSDDSRWWGTKEVERHLKMMSPKNLDKVIQLKAGDSISYRTIYRRKRKDGQRAEVRNDNTAGCLRTARGGSSRQIIIQMGHGQIRMRHMTPREYARLQGVPDNYPIPENTIQALTGFGDAVCVPVIEWIGLNILNPLAQKTMHR